MSNRYKGGVISATPPTTNGPYEDGAASGVWTLEQQMQAAAAGTWPLAGNVGPDAFIENLFQTWLYTGNGSTQTITNGIDLAGKGGLVWVKTRSILDTWHNLMDTVRGPTSRIFSNTTSSASFAPIPSGEFAFNSSGFSLATSDSNLNENAATYASWTFREQPKFFDVVTYTGNGAGPQIINHNLGSAPGCVIVKSTSNTSVWWVWHRGNGGSTDLTGIELNSTNASTFQNAGVASDFTATTFNAGSLINVALNLNPNVNGQTYVAYLFAHNAGGFGLSGSDNVISCGTWSGTGSGDFSGPTVDLGYEPQWILFKKSTGGGGDDNWNIYDNMRGLSMSASQRLMANSSAAEAEIAPPAMQLTATGFRVTNGAYSASGQTYIYIAIRRGPMKVPTTGTSVFSPAVVNAATGTPVTTGFTVDMQLFRYNPAGVPDAAARAFDRLRGVVTNTNTSGSTAVLVTNTTAAESSQTDNTLYWNNTGFQVSSGFSGVTNVFWSFGRAPGFFDEVCYTGDGVNGRTITHNLAAAPELLIVKRRAGGAANWNVGAASGPGWGYVYILNSTGGASLTGEFTPAPTSSVFSVSDSGGVNASGSTYVAYLFASAPGVSKVGSYTGTGTTQTINCGFTAGSRFVMIKRTDDTGDWYVWDSARGIVAGNDPYLLLNSTAAEVTNTDYVDTAATGFEISSTAPAAINASGGTFIFLAIA